MKPVVDAQGFDALTCNRCGECCEGMNLGFNPGEKLAEVRDSGNMHCPELTHEETVSDLQMINGMLEQIGTFPDGKAKYRCKNFSRDADGLGVCGVYEHRPRLCSRFPYGHPQNFKHCSWNVKVVSKVLPMAVS